MNYYKAGLLLLITQTVYSDTYIKIHNNTSYTFQIATHAHGPESEKVTYELDAHSVKPLQNKQIVWIDEQTITKGQEFSLDVILNLNNQNFLCRHLFCPGKKTMISYAVTENQPAQLSWHSDSMQHQTQITLNNTSLLVFSRKINEGSKNTIVEYTLQENRQKDLMESPRHLKILSWNVDMKPCNYVKNGQYQRALLVPEYVRGYDVVVLTDLFDASALHVIHERLKQEYPYSSANIRKTTGVHHYTYEHKGIVFFSKWPIEDYDYQLFNKLCLGYDCHFKKGVAYTCINKQGSRYHLFGTSLQDWPTHKSAIVRYEQIKKIKEIIDNRAISPEEPVIIAGSFYINKYKSSFDDRSRNEYQEMMSMLNSELGNHTGYSFTVDPSINSMARTIDPKELSDYVMYLTTHKKPKKFVQEVCIFKTTIPWQARFNQSMCDLSSHFAVCGTLEF